MFSGGFSFPHPVLGLGDDISGAFNCSMDIERDANQRAIRFHNIKFEITNDYINTIIQDGEAGILMKVYCSSTFKTWTFLNPKDYFLINENDLYNKVEISVFVVTKTQIEQYSDNSFNKQFDGFTFGLNAKEVLAVTGNITMKIEKVDEKLGLGNIFKFFSHSSDKPLQFTYHQNKIHIMYPVDINGEHPPNALFKTSPWTAYNMFIVPALSGAFDFVEEAREEAEGYEWYAVILDLLPEDQWQRDSFVNAQLILKKGIPVLNSYNELTQ